jgi:BirA family biotin operon repressor/biotin-[acetyl-CoA-carboxylase] ligase
VVEPGGRRPVCEPGLAARRSRAPPGAADPDESCRIKWPNDLFVDRRKLGGILVDAITPPRPADSWAIIGFGINYATPASGQLHGATSLLDEAARVGAAAPGFSAFAVGAIEAVWRAATGDASDWPARYMRFAAHRKGDPIRFMLDEGEVQGIFGGFDEHGFLKLETASGVRLIRSGEIYSW